MAFDGITIAALAKELRDNLTGGRIYKIAQPEGDEHRKARSVFSFQQAHPCLLFISRKEINPAP